MRIVIAILIGFLVICVPSAVLLEISGTARAMPPVGFLAFAVVFFAAFGTLGGFVAAVIARRHEVAVAAGVAGILGLLTLVSLIADSGSKWSQCVGLLVALPAAILGGWIRTCFRTS